MASVFSRLIDGCFGTFGLSATFRPAAGGEYPDIQVIRSAPDEVADLFAVRGVLPTNIFDIRAGEAFTPTEGDVIAIGGVDYQIIGRPRAIDGDRLLWRCGAYEVAG